jgi:hypothetical protein
MSLPDGSIYMSDKLVFGTDEYYEVLSHEIDHQERYQNGDPAIEFSVLIYEDTILGKSAYTTPVTREYRANEVQRNAQQILDRRSQQQKVNSN